MDNGPRRHPTFNFFATKEQVQILIDALDGTAINSLLPAAEYQAKVDEKKDIRRRLINLKDAIKRRENKEIRP